MRQDILKRVHHHYYGIVLGLLVWSLVFSGGEGILVLIKTHLAVEKGLKVDFFGFWTGFSQFQAEKAFWKGFKRGSKGHFFGKSIQH